MRAVWDAIQYMAATGCQWAMLPKDFPPFTTVQYYFYLLRNSGLLDLLKTRGSRLGGSTAQYFLRFMGKDSFLTSGDVALALIREGVVDKPPTSKGALKKVQSAFNDWMAESGRPLAQISRVLACTVPNEGEAEVP